MAMCGGNCRKLVWESKEGVIMGIWNSHTSVANIIGSIVASGILEFGWGWSFVVPGALVIFVGILVYLFLVVSPEDIGYETSINETELNTEVNPVEKLENADSEKAMLLDVDVEDSTSMAAIGFLEAWRLLGCTIFLLALFLKLAPYTSLLVALLHQARRITRQWPILAYYNSRHSCYRHAEFDWREFPSFSNGDRDHRWLSSWFI